MGTLWLLRARMRPSAWARGFTWAYAAGGLLLALLVLLDRTSAPLAVALAGVTLAAVPIAAFLSKMGGEAEAGSTKKVASFEDLLGQDELDILLRREVFRARRYARPISVMLIDIGEAADRRTLEDVARRTQDLVRATDDVGVWSERQLLVLLTESREDQAGLLVGRVREKLKSLFPEMQIRIAIASYTDNDSTKKLIERAEKALLA
jgi:GGDEF domain-containing protein